MDIRQRFRGTNKRIKLHAKQSGGQPRDITPSPFVKSGQFQNVRGKQRNDDPLNCKRN